MEPSSSSIVYRVYSWGKAISTNCEPIEVFRILDDAIVDAQAGSLYSLALTASGRVFAWGKGSHGRLGLGDDKDQRIPCCLTFSEPIAAIATSNWFSLFLGRNGVLYRSGKFGGVSVVVPTAASELHGLPPVTACAAGDRCFAVIAAGSVFVVGSSEAMLASLFPLDIIAVGPRAIRVPLPVPAIRVALRGLSFVAICEDGQAYAWGANTSRCLGVESAAAVVWPPAAILIPTATPCASVSGKTAGSLVSASPSTSHINVHALFLDAEGKVHAAGSNYKFKTGIPSSSSRHNNTHSCECIAPPRALPFFSSPSAPRVAHIASGALHSLAVTVDGELLLWGCGSDGRLGFPEFRSRRARYLYHEPSPRLLTGLQGRVITANTFWYHTVAVTAEVLGAVSEA